MFYSETLQKAPTSAAVARGVLDRVRDQVAVEVLDDARLLVSELVANAVEHVAEDGDIEVRIALDERVLHVEVLDPGPGFTYTPRARDVSDSDRGWGLVFTDRIAQRWGNERGRVWFELEWS